LRIVYVPPLPEILGADHYVNGTYLHFQVDAPDAELVEIYLAQPGLLDGDPENIPLPSPRFATASGDLFYAGVPRPLNYPIDWRVRVRNSSGAVWSERMRITQFPARGAFGALGLEALAATSAGVSAMLDGRDARYENVRVAYGTDDVFFDEAAWSAVRACDSQPGSSTWRTELSGLLPGRRYYARFFADHEDGSVAVSGQRLDFVTGSDPDDLIRWGLRFSEIMYHPLGASDEERLFGFGEDDFEYIELHNATDRPVDLSGWYFSSGIDHAFPISGGPVIAPGQYGIIAANPHAFAMRYGDDIPIMAYTSHPFRRSKLSNGGESLTLNSPDDSLRISTNYLDENFGSDGDGHSLELDPGGNWVASRAPGGTPGFLLPFAELSFAAWQQSVFTPEQLADPVISGGGQDPDGDGLVNSMEFLYGKNPLAGDRRDQFRLVGEIERWGGTYLEFALEQAPRVDTGSITVEQLGAGGRFTPLQLGYYYLDKLRWSADGTMLIRTIIVFRPPGSEAHFRARFGIE
jgi:hypothetical protein